MSHYDDTFKAHKKANSHKLSTPHMRALRKELLIARADVERMEVAQANADLRYSIKNFSVLKFLMPGRRSNSRRSSSSGFLSKLSGLGGLGNIGGMMNNRGIGLLLRQYPVVSSLVSLLLAKPVRTRLLHSAKPLLKWGGLGLVGWEAYRVYQQMQTPAVNPTTEAPEVVDPNL
jgi:hypothetical protein